MKTPPAGLTTFNGADFTTTATTFEDVDDTEGGGKHTITIAGTQVLIFAMLSVSNNSASARTYFNISVDGSDHFVDDGLLVMDTPILGEAIPITLISILTGLSAGQRVFRLRWKVSAGTATLYGGGTAGYDVHAQFYVGEWR